MLRELHAFLEEQTGTLLLVAGVFLCLHVAGRAVSNVAGGTIRESFPEWAAFMSPIRLLGLWDLHSRLSPS